MKAFKWFLRFGVLVLLFVAAFTGGSVRLIADVIAAVMASLAIGIYVGEWSAKRKRENKK